MKKHMVKKAAVFTLSAVMLLGLTILSIGVQKVSASEDNEKQIETFFIETPRTYPINDNITAILDVDGVLTLKGRGDMPSYDQAYAPWYSEGSDIKHIIIEEGITSVGDWAFRDCGYIDSVYIASTVKSIGKEAFDYGGVNTVSGMESVTSIGDRAFENCNLTSFTFPSCIESIGNSVFAGCKNLKTLHIPKSVTSLEAIGYKCTGLESITVEEGNERYTSVDGVLYNKDMTILLQYPAAKQGINFVVPASVSKIEAYAFAWNQCLQKMELPFNVTAIGEGTFSQAAALTTLQFSANIEIVPHGMCFECTSLSTVVFDGNSIKEIDYGAFRNCRKLTQMVLPAALEKIQGAAFQNCTSFMSVSFPSTMTYISESAFENSGVSNMPEWLTKTDNGDYRMLTILNSSGTYLYDRAYEVLELVNKERMAEGLEPLIMDTELLEAAMLRAAECNLYFSHTRPNQEDCFTASRKMNGENIAAGNTEAAGVMYTWSTSLGHWANILGRDWKSVGIGCFTQGETVYWTQCFSSEMGDNAQKPANRLVNVQIQTDLDLLKSEYLSFKDDTHILLLNKETALQPLVLNEGWNTHVFEIDPSCFTWTSSDTNIATVDSKGIVKGLKSGNVIITAKLNRAPYTSFSYKGIVTSGEMSDCEIILKKNKYVYKGTTIKPSFIVKCGEVELQEGRDYKTGWSYRGSYYGIVTYRVVGKGKFSGKKTVDIQVVPKKVKILSIKAGSKKLTVKYKKIPKVTGYQIAYAKNKNGPYKTVKTTEGVKTLTKLSKNKKYYVKVRAYVEEFNFEKGVNEKYYGPYSLVVSKKTK